MHRSVRSYPKSHEDVPLGPNINVAIAVWPELILQIAKIWFDWWKLLKFDLTDGLHPSVSNLSKCFDFQPNLNEAFLICPDLIEAVW